jgi:hypothetical protein
MTTPREGAGQRWPGIRLWGELVREAGWRHGLSLAALALLGTLLEASGLGLAVTVLLGGGALSGSAPPPLAPHLAIALLILVMTLRALLQAGDGEAIDLVQAHRASLQRLLGAASFRAMESELERVAFEAAAEVLEAATPAAPALASPGSGESP